MTGSFVSSASDRRKSIFDQPRGSFMGKTDKKSPEKKASYIVKENHLRGVYIENLSEIVCESAEEAYNLLIQGLSRKKMFATVKNQCSSRSHTVFMFKLFTRQALPDKNDKGSFLGGAQF